MFSEFLLHHRTLDIRKHHQHALLGFLICPFCLHSDCLSLDCQRAHLEGFGRLDRYDPSQRPAPLVQRVAGRSRGQVVVVVVVAVEGGRRGCYSVRDKGDFVD